MTKLIDAHSHLNFPDYDADREAVITRAREAGIGMINVGTDFESSRQAVALAEQNENMWATVGLHPTDSGEGFDYEKYLGLAKHEKTVAIGECGIDRGRKLEVGNWREQIPVFEAQIALARQVTKPLMLHIRNAYREVRDILTSNPPPPISNAHFFAGNWEEAQLFLDLGFTLSFTGVITFARDYDEVIKNTPIESILVETDCPFVAPVPYRGKRNEPSYVVAVAQKIAEIKGLSYEAVAETTLANTRRVFNLPKTG